MTAVWSLVLPFPYFGGKSTIAADVWERFGDVSNFIEPFFGSGAVLLARPDAHQWWDRTETVNDLDGMIANFWRSVAAEPDAVAHWADWPVNENDLHARHSWLLGRKADLQSRLEGDPDYHEAKVAGWWLWGVCQWIGSGWCSGKGPWVSVDGQLVKSNAGQGVNRQRPHLSNAGQGVNRKRPELRNGGEGIHRQLPSSSNNAGVHAGVADGPNVCAAWTAHLEETMRRLSNRLRRVRVCCGDWSRICGPSVTIAHGLTGVFLDPPYSHAERTDDLYTTETDCAAQVREWAIANGDNPLLRIALCGYDEEHVMPESWECIAWKARGGYGSQGDGMGRQNADRERIWFSPHCLKPDRPIQSVMPLPADAGDET